MHHRFQGLINPSGYTRLLSVVRQLETIAETELRVSPGSEAAEQVGRDIVHVGGILLLPAGNVRVMVARPGNDESVYVGLEELEAVTHGGDN